MNVTRIITTILLPEGVGGMGKNETLFYKPEKQVYGYIFYNLWKLKEQMTFLSPCINTVTFTDDLRAPFNTHLCS